MRQCAGKILVTGATGFVGSFLCRRLLTEGWHVCGTVQKEKPARLLEPGVEAVEVGSLGPATPWREALVGIHTIIHLAARVHIMADPAADPQAEFSLVNTEGTSQLAREAATAGVKRLVFVSSIKVNGEEAPVPYTESSVPQPTDPYGISKWEAEQALREIEAETGLEVIIIRPTLVYGPGVKANFRNLLKIVHGGIPLPLASIVNRRSLVYVGNLVDALVVCATHPKAAGKTFLVSDGENVSTPELVRRTAAALGVPARLFPVPVPLMRLAGFLTGKSPAVDRLTGSLAVDSSRIREELEWTPPFSMDDGLRATAEWFLKVRGGAV